MAKYQENFTNEEEDDWVSKSSVKRYGKHLRELGIKIVALSNSEFDRIPFEDDDTLKEACLTARKLKARSEELRRELLHIEALLRSREDFIERYETALQNVRNDSLVGQTAFYELEETRRKLLQDGITAINDLIAQHKELDRQKLRSLVTKAQKEIADETNQNKKAYKELFQYLKNNLL